MMMVNIHLELKYKVRNYIKKKLYIINDQEILVWFVSIRAED